jgi:uncharacterized membrane protein YgcG
MIRLALLTVVAGLTGAVSANAVTFRVDSADRPVSALAAAAVSPGSLLQLARHRRIDDPANHDMMDDNGVDNPAESNDNSGNDDGPNHDANDDHGNGGGSNSGSGSGSSSGGSGSGGSHSGKGS